MENNYPQISVIVPVYNVEKYLPQCIDSILKQDFLDFELLLIDDGSKDKSSLICDEYTRQDKRVKVFHKENGGVSSARNLGIDKAQGEFIAFIDSDDYIASDYLSTLLKSTADLVITGYKQIGNDGSLKTEYSFSDSILEEHQIADYLASTLNIIPMRVPWDKLFKRTIIKEHNIRFNPLLRMSEDAVFVQTYLLYCHTLALKSGTSYFYRLEPNVDQFFKYSLSEEEYIYSLRTTTQTYHKLTQHFGFTCREYNNINNKDMLRAYFRGVTKKGITFKGFSNYKKTMELMCPNVSFSSKLYVLSYKLIQKKMFFLSFCILRLVYPIKLNLKKL